jgi:toxin-antitoxin system PIN domain toxin
MKRASSNRPLLLDVNVLLAIAWPNHQFHAVALRRLARGDEWATCALTELAFVRLSSNPAIVSPAATPAEAAALLSEMIGDSRHRYVDKLPSAVAPETSTWFGRILGHKQVNDGYLLALAKSSGTKLLTFDSRIQTLGGASVEIEVLRE